MRKGIEWHKIKQNTTNLKRIKRKKERNRMWWQKKQEIEKKKRENVQKGNMWRIEKINIII